MSNSEEHEAYIREHCDIQSDEDYEMDLTVKDRKKLWSSAGNKCAWCKCILHQKKSKTNIGEECHISSERPDHPSKEFSRYDPGFDQRNTSVDNAIILCANCHKIIDNPENTQYTIEELHRIKERHEVEVEKNPDVVKERSERRKKLENWIETHNKDLIDSVFKPWYIHKILFNWYDLPEKNSTEFKEFLQNRFGIKDTEIVEIQNIDAKTIRVFFNKTFLSLELNDDKTKLSLEIYNGRTEQFIAKEENGKLNVYEINPIDMNEETLALDHLKEYTDFWKLRENCITLQESISKEEVAINEYILTKLEHSTLLNFTRDCSSDEGEVVMCLYNIIKKFSSAGRVPDTYQLHPSNNPGAGCAFTFNKNKQELREHYENSRKQNEIIIKDKTLNEMIGKVICDKANLTKEMNEFEQSIDAIVYDFGKKHIPLKGTCDDCEDWHKELESLK